MRGFEPSGEALLTVQISGNTRGEETARRYSERAAKVNHAGEGAAVKDVETVLLRK
jgi:hypothetical protein